MYTWAKFVKKGWFIQDSWDLRERRWSLNEQEWTLKWDLRRLSLWINLLNSGWWVHVTKLRAITDMKVWFRVYIVPVVFFVTGFPRPLQQTVNGMKLFGNWKGDHPHNSLNMLSSQEWDEGESGKKRAGGGGGRPTSTPSVVVRSFPTLSTEACLLGISCVLFADGNNNCMASGENLLASLFAIDTDAQ